MSTTTCQSSGGVAIPAFAAAVEWFAAIQCAISDAPPGYPESAELVDGQEYDFIIVGAGTAGSILASRLSEVPDITVLLVEAGGDPPPESTIPQLSNTLRGTVYDWQFKTVNDGVSVQALANGYMEWAAGKMISGCTGMNPIFYDRGSDEDYQAWNDLVSEQWGPDIATKYFEMMENLQDPKLLNDSTISAYYGKNGPIQIGTSEFTYEDMLTNIVDSWDEIGIPKQQDLNVAKNLGSGKHRTIDIDGKRNNIAKFYLNPIASNRTNLHIVKNAYCNKVIIDSDFTTRGVEIDLNGTIYTMYVTKEVILSAGAIKTPQLLMMSGIGPTDHLESMGITTLVDSYSVGRNLQTHSYVPVLFTANKPEPLTQADEDFYAIEYLYNSKGYLAQPIQSHVTALFGAESSAIFPDYQVHLVVHYKNSSTIEKRIASRFIDTETSNIMAQTDGLAVMEFSVQVLHPESAGRIELQSSNAQDAPLIYYNSFEESADLDSAATGCQIVTQLLNTTCFQSMEAKLVTMDFCKDFELDSTDYWKCVAYNMSTSLFHPVGTCRMGADNSTSVVDGSLKVFGVTGLRCVDGSVIPYIPSGNTFAPIAMVGERAADIIKNDYDWTDYMHQTV